MVLHWEESLPSNENRKQIKLSIRTKIAAWWMNGVGIFLVVLGVSLVIIYVISYAVFCVISSWGSMSGCDSGFYSITNSLERLALAPLYLPSLYGGGADFFEYEEAIGWSFICGVLMILFSRFLVRKKRWAWIFSIILFLLISVFPIILSIFIITIMLLSERGITIDKGETPIFLIGSFLGVLLYVVPLVLLFLDRKNFSKVA